MNKRLFQIILIIFIWYACGGDNNQKESVPTTSTTTTIAPTTTSTTTLSNTCTAWRDSSEENRLAVDIILNEYVQNYISYQASNLSLNSFVNSITQQVNLSSEILTKQRELIPNNPNVEANTQLKLGIADYALALGFYKKGWAEEDNYYLTMGDIYLDSADSYIFYYKLYREGC